MTLEQRLSSDEKKVLVVGAGMVGVSAAWHLQRRGFQVTMIDRKGPGEETSSGCAGLIQRECVMPYSIPSGFLNRVRIVLNTKVDVRYNIFALPQNLYAIYLYWRNSSPSLYGKNCKEFASLIVHCTDEHEAMIKASHSEKLVRKLGFLELFRMKSIPAVQDIVEEQRSKGVTVDLLTTDDIKEKEPSLNVEEFTCGLHFKDAWQVADPGALVKAYANSFVSLGGTVVQAAVKEIAPRPEAEGGGWLVSTETGDFAAPRVVVATGPWSNEVLRSLGYKFPLIPLRGYNTHFKLADGAQLNHSIVDITNGYVLGPMNAGVRLTTGGEVTTMATPPNEIQLRKAEALARKLLPLENQIGGVWHGHRPLIADMKPIIGESPIHAGLWMCFGHGYQGFTLGPISGRVLAEMMAKEKAIVDPTPFSVDRFL
ncbi:D-amino-acid dehydrogenase [Leptomonas pyrrhocoris]|uniref:D-amino-acid dehydrogenase n=1 Tax=Leptomonas pyrrhocoris TaxID=157538 RepID=A0A0N0DQI0_LEPPY|nr:D-amino-acid dehydrogenase [Leptomonas pyrrhocoris]KPA73238.1 D-amino-acid dehydrogenase [Leptomonas pyrrhocoris]|eukprot:XP_015651677.1 D-amino-acid dehydrogenase [Leptomonas pyrrhocoris]